MYLTAPLALGVLKIDRPLAGGFFGLTALSGLKVVETAVAAVYSRLTAEKTNNRASPVEMHPFCLRHLPRRGRFALCLTFISYVMNRISEISRLQRLFPLWYLRHHLPAPLGSVSHDSQVALLPYSTAITDSQYFARHCVPSKYVRWCDSCSLATPMQGAE